MVIFRNPFNLKTTKDLIINFAESGFRIKANFLYTAAIFYSTAIYMVCGILIKRIVLPEIVGAFAFVTSVSVVLNMPNSVIRSALNRLVPKYLGMDEKKSAYTIAGLSLIFLLISALTGCVLLNIFGLFFKKDIWQFYAFICLSIIFVIDSIATFFTVYVYSLNKIKRVAYIFFIRATCLNIIWYLNSLLFNNVGYYSGYLLGSITDFIITYYFTKDYIPWKEIKPSLTLLKNVWKNKFTKEIWHIGSLLVFYAMIFELFLSVDKYFIKFLKGNAMLAFYTFAGAGTQVVVSSLSSFVGSFAPKMYFNFAAGKDQGHLLGKLTFIAMLASYAAAFIIFTQASSIVKIILPNYMQSVPFFKILAFVAIPHTQYNIGYIVAIGKNKVSLLIWGMCILLVVSIVLNWFFYKLIGINGIAVATVASILLIYLMISFLVHADYHSWYTTLIFLPLLFLNCQISKHNMQLAFLFFIVVVFVCLYFLSPVNLRKKTQNL